MNDLDVNMAIWGVFLNATLGAAVHLGQGCEANLRYVKNNLWNSAGQLFRETGKLISTEKEITGVGTIDFKDATSSPTLCSAWEKWEMIPLRPGTAKLNGIRKTTTSRI